MKIITVLLLVISFLFLRNQEISAQSALSDYEKMKIGRAHV